MQRIDENTYIDDTLVTCAEYQLFIDEMREQGEYHQPDHWTSYQFQSGQAREPILGARHSDAVAFCEWLTQRDDGEWKFRLPTQEEADAFTVKPIGIRPLGYWIGKGYQFTWIGVIPKDACILDLNRALDRARNRSLATALEIALDRDLAINRAFNLNRARVRAHNRNRDTYKDVYTLQERIAGRSPAFEGIRLVKERIR